MAEQTMLENNAEFMTPERLEVFLDDLRQKGRRKTTIDSYREALKILCRSLPGGALTPSTWVDWKREMEEQGLQAATINQRLSALNTYLTQIGRRSWCGADFLPRERKSHPELTRSEYCRLLSTAQRLEKDKTYLLIKLMGSFGVEVKDLTELTVEAVEAGQLQRERNGPIRFTEQMREELLAYIHLNHLREGLVFRTASGRLMDRKHIHAIIETVSKAAQVDPKKTTPRSLHRMYQQTRADYQSRAATIAEREYQRLLESEQRKFGWNEEKTAQLLQTRRIRGTTATTDSQ